MAQALLSAKPADTRRLYQQIADQIRAFIRERQLAPGARLPPERELAVHLGVSRPSVREALIALEIGGSVEIRMGSGVYVGTTPQALAEHATPSLGESPSELAQARAMLEGEVVSQAAARADAQGLERIQAALDAMRQDGLQGRSPIGNDRAFHTAIAEMTGNSVLVRLVGELFDGRHNPISSRLSARAEDASAWQAAHAEHEALFRALQARDPHAARAALLYHLGASHARWIEAGAESHAAGRQRARG